MKLSSAIRAARKSKQLTQVELAELGGVSLRTVKALEHPAKSKNKGAQIGTLINVASALDMSVSELLRDVQEVG